MKIGKCLSIFLGVIFTIMTFTCNVQASSIQGNNIKPTKTSKEIFYENVDPKSVVTTYMTEYDILSKFKNKPTTELLKEGFSAKEIKEIKELDYEKELRKKASLNKPTLKKQGYTDSQITNLKNTVRSSPKKMTSRQIRSISGKLEMNVGINTITNNYRDWKVFYTWCWTKSPIFMLTDIIAINGAGTISGLAAKPIICNDSYSSVSYDSDYGDHAKYLKTYTTKFTLSDNSAGSAKFPLTRTETDPAVGRVRAWAHSGYGMIHFNNSHSMDRLLIALKYGHNELHIEPSANFSAGSSTSAAVNFTFSVGVNAESSTVVAYNRNGKIVN